jgi:malonate decarboxylase gamma subunit
MTLDELLGKLFPAGHETHVEEAGILCGTGLYGENRVAAVLGVVNQAPLGIEGALALSGCVLQVIRQSPRQPIVVLLDGQSQRMRRRDEMLGLNEYLAHLTKCFVLASQRGHRTVGVIFGTIAAGAFISTGLAQDLLVAVPGADPQVMDMPSIARVTKLPREKLDALSKTTPVFAPGLNHAMPIGAVAEIWEGPGIAAKLAAAMQEPAGGADRRDQLGLERKGRLNAAEIAERVEKEADNYVATVAKT